MNKPKKLTVSYLRKKYPHPVRGICGDDYCVGGALCREIGMKLAFPQWDQLRDAVEAVTGINRYMMSDEDQELLRQGCELVITDNDNGNFNAAWRQLGNLLRWRPASNLENPKPKVRS